MISFAGMGTGGFRTTGEAVGIGGGDSDKNWEGTGEGEGAASENEDNRAEEAINKAKRKRAGVSLYFRISLSLRKNTLPPHLVIIFKNLTM
jgi:hypothetical protein